MNAVDCHTHWFPTDYYDFLASRSIEPRAKAEDDGSYHYINGNRSCHPWPEWFDLAMQFETVAKTGIDMAMVTSLGIHADLDGLPVPEARHAARMINEAWAAAQLRHPGRFFAAAAVPLGDTTAAIDELDYAITKLDLRGVSMPSSIAGEPIDAPRLEPFYARVEELGVPLFIHPNDGVLVDAMAGHDNALYMSLGRVVDSSLAVLRLVLNGTLDRYPGLKILHFHAGGVLPYAAGRLDKNARLSTLEHEPTAYLKRMWVDTAMPHSLTIEMALKFYGGDRVLYGSDNPCWNQQAALKALEALELSDAATADILNGNACQLLDLRAPGPIDGAAVGTAASS